MSSDSVLIAWYFIREQYENICNQNIATPLKHLMAQYADKIIGCKILTIKEDVQLFRLLSSEVKDNICYKQFKLLYRASENNYSAKAFHAKCDHYSNTIIIIQSNFNNIFGGYLSIPWPDCFNNNNFMSNYINNNYLQYADDNSFLFVMRSKNKELNSSRIECKGVDYVSTRGPIFCAADGNRQLLHIGDQCNTALPRKQNWNLRCFTSDGNICGNNISDDGEHYYFQVIDYAVFEIV
eukprot:439641_1